MKDEFEKFNNNYREKLEKYFSKFYKRKNNIIFKFLMVLCVFEMIYIVFSLILFKEDILKLISIIICTLIIVIVFIFAIYKALKREKIYITDNIILDIVKFISKDDNSVFDPGRMISKETISKMELFNLEKLQYTGKNVIQSNFNGNPMSFSDMNIFFNKEIESEESFYDKNGNKKTKIVKNKVKKYIFNGCYISAKMNKKILEHIYLIPNRLSDLIINGKINDYIMYDGDEVELENLEFSEKYKVYSNDEIQARYILSVNLMEKIINIDKIFDNKKFIVFKEDGRFAICIQGFSIQKLRKTNLPNNFKKEKMSGALYYLFKNIYNLFDIYNILDLGNDLFVNNK